MAAPAWVWVTTRNASFGVVVRDGVIIEAAPIARWAVGKDERLVADRFRRQGAVFERLRDEDLMEEADA